MKKNGIFKILCLVLAVALLSPNVFAATPAPEVPLADAATVARVKQEIADGQITDMEDVFLVAYQHLGADINEDGMTAYINEDGRLEFAQIICSENTLARSDVTGEKTYAVTTLSILDIDSRNMRISEYYPSPDTVSSQVAGTNLVVTHTTYYSGQIVPGYYDDEEDDDDLQIRVKSMSTSIYGASPPYYATKLVQTYEYLIDGQAFESDSKTTTGSLSGAYSFITTNSAWHSVPSFIHDAIVTGATVYVVGVSQPLTLEISVSLGESIPA